MDPFLELTPPPDDAEPFPEGTTPSGKEALQTFGELFIEEKQLSAKLALIKAKREKLEPIVRQWLTEHGLKNVKAEGVTLYIARTLWARVEGGEDGAEESTTDERYERACAALRAAGWDEFVKERFNVQSLSKRVRELVKAAEEQGLEFSDVIPPEFEGAIRVDEEFKVQARRS